MTITLLGYGYTAQYLKKYLFRNHPDFSVKTTSRSSGQDIIFDLEDVSTWSQLEPSDITIWFFPASPPEIVQRFLQSSAKKLGQIVVVGSTGAFLTETEHQIVDEGTPRDREWVRVQGEDLILQSGGILVCAAGIYGPERNPLHWVEKGRVSPSSRLLNVIYVEDLARLLFRAAQLGEPGRIYVASDGHPYSWDELIDHWQSVYSVKVTKSQTSSKRKSKRVDPSNTFERLNFAVNVTDVITGVALLRG